MRVRLIMLNGARISRMEVKNFLFSAILYLMAESLREAACVGNLFAVKKMLNNGVCVNSQNAMNGW